MSTEGKFRRFASVAVFALIAGVSGCQKGSAPGDGDPKQRLQEYISHSFDVHSGEQRKELLSYLTGDARARLESWSDEQFRQAFVETKRQFSKLAFKDQRKVSDKEVNITYEISYTDQSKGHDAHVTNRKLCELTLENGKWMIADVHNIAELVEYKNEMSLP